MVTTWKTKDGNELEIKNMSEEHIKNCMKMVERNIDRINRNSTPSYYDKEIHYEMDYSESPIWRSFYREMKIRKLGLR